MLQHVIRFTKSTSRFQAKDIERIKKKIRAKETTEKKLTSAAKKIKELLKKTTNIKRQ